MSELRRFLLKLLAGKSIVVINANISYEKGLIIKRGQRAYVQSTEITGLKTGITVGGG